MLPEAALEDAAAADKALAEADDPAALPALLGIPLAIKDVILVEGAPATCGSRILEDFVPPFEATVIGKLRAAGAVILGKTNTDEFAMGSSTENSAYFTTRNPWDLSRVPGGSSGGSAAAVAADECLGALGIGHRRQRAPAGLAVRRGRHQADLWPGQPLRAGGLCLQPRPDRHAGQGCDRRGPAVAAPSPATTRWTRPAWTRRCPTIGARRLTGQTVKPGGLRVGVPREYFIDGMQPEVEQAVRAAIDNAGRSGRGDASRSACRTPQYALPVYYLIAPAEASANLARYDGVRYGLRHPDAQTMWEGYQAMSRGAGFGPEVKRRIMLGTYALSAGYYDAYYLKAQQVRTLLKRDFDQAFEQVDVIACPVSPTTAFKIGEKADDPLSMYLADVFTLSLNLAGNCGLSVPCGFDQQGLPIGLQLIGPAFGEAAILRAAYAYEQATDWHARRPEIGLVDW